MAVTLEERRPPAEGIEYLLTLAEDDVVVVSPGIVEHGLFAWLVKPETSATVNVKVAMRTDPGAGDWADHAKHATISENAGDAEDSPFAHIRFEATDGGAELHLQAPARFPLHIHAPALAALTVAAPLPTPTIEVDASVEFDASSLISYALPNSYLRYTAAGGGTTVTATVPYRAEKAEPVLRLVGAAAGTANVTLTARTPDGATAQAVVPVIVEAATP